MSLKLTIQGILIYGTMLAYLGAAGCFALKRRKQGDIIYFIGFLLAAAAFVYRWVHAGHAPLQNLFEVFLCLGMLMYPLSWACRRFLEVPGEGMDAFIGFAILFPAGFVFSAEPQKLPPALQSWFFVPHVAAYMLAYVILVKAAVQALRHLWAGRQADSAENMKYELYAYRTVRLGFPLLTLGLLLGSWWAKVAWGDYWNWDPKELWSLATWLVYAGYIHVRFAQKNRFPRLNSSLVLVGAVFIVITLLWVNLAAKLFPGLHTYAT